MKSNIEALNPILAAQSRHRYLSFEGNQWSDMEQWKALGKGKVTELLRYHPKPAPLDAVTHSMQQRDGYRLEKVSYASGKGVRIPAYLLIPDGEGPFPGVVALHDHGGFYYWGKEKIVDTGIQSRELDQFLAEGFDGTYWASELVKKGYVVLVADALYFGERRLRLEDVPDYAFRETNLPGNPLEGLVEGSEEYIARFNEICTFFEAAMERTLRFSGIEWPGILAQDDRAGVSYLCQRPEVDVARIGCCGLSLGGFRSALLVALDSRIRCGVVAGWMVTFDSLLPRYNTTHTNMVSIHGLPDVMDLPDMVSLGFPTPLLVQQCSRDSLYSVEGMQAACDKIEAVYRAGGHPERYAYSFTDHAHQFCRPMQAEATAWLDRWLKG